MFHTHNGSSQVNDTELLVDHFPDRDLVILFRIRIYLRITVVYAVDGLCEENAVRIHFDRHQSDRRVGREIRLSDSTGKKYDHSVLKILVRTVLGEQFCHISALERGEDLCLHSRIAEDLGYINTVHHSREHSDLIRLGPIDCIALATSPEVSAADHDTYFDSVIDRRLNLSGYFLDRCFIKPGFLVACQRFSAQLQ